MNALIAENSALAANRRVLTPTATASPGLLLHGLGEVLAHGELTAENLGAARGLVFGALLGGTLWMVLAVIICLAYYS